METPRRLHLADLVCFILLALAVRTAAAADEIPKRPDFARYTAMIKKSPFAVATAVVVPAATPSFAKDLYISNAAHTADGDFVTVQSAIDRNLKEYLTTKGPNEHGYAISSIEWSEKPGQTKVTISKDGQFSPLSFNQALMAPTGQPSMPQPGGVNMVPGQPAVPAPAYIPPKPPNAAGMPTPQPHTRGLIQRNPSTVQRPNNETVDQ